MNNNMATQYSAIADIVTTNLFQVYLLRPDGSELLRLNGSWAGSESDFWENKRYAEILADELNSLLVLPQCDICKKWKALNPDGLCQGCVDDLIEEYQQQRKEDLKDYRASTIPDMGRVDR